MLCEPLINFPWFYNGYCYCIIHALLQYPEELPGIVIRNPRGLAEEHVNRWGDFLNLNENLAVLGIDRKVNEHSTVYILICVPLYCSLRQELQEEAESRRGGHMLYDLIEVRPTYIIVNLEEANSLAVEIIERELKMIENTSDDR